MSVQLYSILFVLLCILVASASAIATSKVTKKDFYDKMKLDIALEEMVESEKKIKSQIEQLADYTAAALLMPVDHVFDFLQEKNYMQVSAKKRMVYVRELCKEYRVNEMIVLRRIKEVYALKQK